MDEDRLAAAIRGNKSEALIVLPLGDSPLVSHEGAGIGVQVILLAEPVGAEAVTAER